MVPYLTEEIPEWNHEREDDTPWRWQPSGSFLFSCCGGGGGVWRSIVEEMSVSACHTSFWKSSVLCSTGSGNNRQKLTTKALSFGCCCSRYCRTLLVAEEGEGRGGFKVELGTPPPFFSQRSRRRWWWCWWWSFLSLNYYHSKLPMADLLCHASMMMTLQRWFKSGRSGEKEGVLPLKKLRRVERVVGSGGNSWFLFFLQQLVLRWVFINYFLAEWMLLAWWCWWWWEARRRGRKADFDDDDTRSLSPFFLFTKGGRGVSLLSYPR